MELLLFLNDSTKMAPRKTSRKKTSKRSKKTTKPKRLNSSRSRRSRRSAPQLEIQAHVMREIWAVVYGGFCILTILSVNGNLGVVGTFWNNFLTPIFGWGIYLVPVLLGGISLALFFARRVMFDFTRVFGIGLMVVSALSTIHLSVPADEIYEVARLGQYGGYIGFVGSFIARQVLGVTGAYVVYLSLFMISVLMTFSISIREIMSIVQVDLRPRRRAVMNKTSIKKEKEEEDKVEDFDIDDMVIHTMGGANKDEMETIHLRQVDPGEHDLKPEEETSVAVNAEVEDEEELEGEKIPVEKIAEQLEEAEAEAESELDKPWEFPPLDLLDDSSADIKLNQDLLKENAEKIRTKLGQFGIQVKMHEVHVGPTVIQYTLKPDEGVKLSKIIGLKNDLALALAARAIRIEAPIPGKSLVGIEVPNDTRAIVHLRELIESDEFDKLKKKSNSKLFVPMGRSVNGTPIVEDLATMPHMLVAGATGAGKSVFTNTVLTSFLYHNSPRDLKLILVDPKRVELRPYNGIPHLLTPVITEPDKAAIALRWVVAEMTRRYTVCADAGHRSIDEYNADPNSPQSMPKIVVMIDELADLMMVAGKEVEASICRIAQMARAVGIHLIIATQRPSVDVITGLIKANIPARVAFTVASSIDSRTILDGIGAEDLLGRGDMLYLSGTSGKPIRIQGAFLDTKEIQAVTNRVKLTLDNEPVYNEEITSRKTAGIKVHGVPDSAGSGGDDELYEQAMEIIRRSQKASATMLQRHLKVGYSRAARLIDMLEENGVVGPARGSKPREVFVAREEA